jgi:hypothetical protein
MSMADIVAKIGKSQEKSQDLPPKETDPSVIGNGDFTSQLDKLQRLRNFIVSHNIKETKDQESKLAIIDLGKLNSIRYGENGREPSDVEWDDLNKKLQYFYSLLSETDLRKFHFKLAVPMLKLTPTALVFCSIFFLIIPNVIAAFFGMPELPANWLVSRVAFLGWIVTVGALGSMAFILVNALGIQVDPTVDVTDRDSTMFRVLLGALFSVILTLPFGFPTFEEFLKSLKNVDPKDGALLLMPFLFGFSTSLVLTILNRLVDAVQTFFGVNTKSPPPPK